jgi:hypothetical protein
MSTTTNQNQLNQAAIENLNSIDKHRENPVQRIRKVFWNQPRQSGSKSKVEIKWFFNDYSEKDLVYVCEKYLHLMKDFVFKVKNSSLRLWLQQA